MPLIAFLLLAYAGSGALGVRAARHGGRWRWAPWLAILLLAVVAGVLTGIEHPDSGVATGRRLGGCAIAAGFLAASASVYAAIGRWSSGSPVLALLLVLAAVPPVLLGGLVALVAIAADLNCPHDSFRCGYPL